MKVALAQIASSINSVCHVKTWTSYNCPWLKVNSQI